MVRGKTQPQQTQTALGHGLHMSQAGATTTACTLPAAVSHLLAALLAYHGTPALSNCRR